MADETAAAVGADQIAAAQRLAAVPPGQPRHHPVCVLVEAFKFAAVKRQVAELREPLAHHSLGPELRDHQRRPVGFLGGRRRVHEALGLVEAPVVAMDALRRIGRSGRQDLIDDS